VGRHSKSPSRMTSDDLHAYVPSFATFSFPQAGASNKKASGFVDSISKSFSKLMCGGNALKNIDDDDRMVMQVQSPARGPARSPTRSPAMKPSGTFRPRLCALDFDLTLTQNQVRMWCSRARLTRSVLGAHVLDSRDRYWVLTCSTHVIPSCALAYCLVRKV
jgi:hypothetical protein